MDESQLNPTEFEEVVFHDPIESSAVVVCKELVGCTEEQSE